MNKTIQIVAVAVLMVGCSKKEDTTPSSPVAPVASANQAPTPVSNKPEVKTPAAEPPATNVPLVSAESNVVVSTNAAAVNPKGIIDTISGTSAALTLAGLSPDQVTQGLKQALAKGLDQAIKSVGKPGGFLNNASVKIPLPEKLQSVEKTLRAIGQGDVADQCITTMNQAAEQAVPLAADVFANSLKNMSVADAKAILNGPADAATDFFRRTAETELKEKFQPIVQQAMNKCGATAAYSQVMDKAKLASPFFSIPSLDLNAYVTGKAMDGLFKMVAEEEKNIRANPVARTTDLLKNVFGSLTK